MPKKSGVPKTPSMLKSLELDKKLNAIKGEVALADAIIDEEEIQQKEPEVEEPVLTQHVKKQPKIIEEIVEEEDPEPVIIRKRRGRRKTKEKERWKRKTTQSTRNRRK
jgi:hypothetical protein